MSTVALLPKPSRVVDSPVRPKRVVGATLARRTPRASTLAKVLSIVSFLASVGICVWAWLAGSLKDVDGLRAAIGGLGWWTVALFIIIQAAQVVVPILPGGIGLLAGVILFGPVLGSVWNYIGICAGSIIAFGIARSHGPELLERRFSPKLLTRYRKWTDSPRFTTFLAIAIAAPVAPDDFLCYWAGTTKMRWRTFIIIILTCKPWAILAYSFGLMALATHFGIVGR